MVERRIFIVNNEFSLLLDAYNNGMLNSDVSDTLNILKKNRVNDIHKNAITKPINEKGRWQTYIDTYPDGERKKRVKVSSMTESGLYDKLFEFYYGKNVKSLKDIYPEWIEKRNLEGLSPRTIERNKNHWNKYYINDSIVTTPLVKLTAEQIENFFHKVIKQYQLSVKELNNMKLIMTDMLKMAYKRKYIDSNPYNDVDINTNACRQVIKHTASSRVYFPDEKEKLFNALNDEIKLKPNSTDCFAVFLLFKLGVRIGELVALKWTDIDYTNNEIHICRMESKEYNSDGDLRVTVVEHTKKKSTDGDRFLPIGDYEKVIFEKIREISKQYNFKEQEYIFCDENGRTKIRAIDNLIRKLCGKCGIEEKSSHDIRRTVASELNAQGVNVEMIRVYLGHSDIKTTFGYIYNNRSKQETNNLLLNSLSQMNGLAWTQS